jgi:uncharacterized membrane protein
VNEVVGRGRILSALLVSALLLVAVAWLRGAEYDEQYTMFVTGRVVRPIWPADVITADEVRAPQAAHAGFGAIARDLRATDVHPPLYFWLVRVWRGLAGDSLFAARLASVLCSLATLCLVAVIARSARIPPAPAVLLTCGCYGFAYTGAMARGFALAGLLSVAGIALLLAAPRDARRMFAAGALLGAATFTNYLSAFTACAALLFVIASSHRPSGGGSAAILRPLRPLLAMTAGLAFWLPGDLWFFLGQRQARSGQFASFQPVVAASRLARYAAANLFGGLPLYFDGMARTAVTVTLGLLLVGLITVTTWRWRRLATPEARLLLAMAACAPPLGLLLLGLVFDNTPIELRYLAFATPFVGLLLAAALPASLRVAVLAVQAVALLGLMMRPETMQPARLTAITAAAWSRDGVTLLPNGNDGVGIVGAFAAESAPATRLLVIDRDATSAQVRARVSRYPRVVLALLGQDAASRETLPVMRGAFTDPCWRVIGNGFNVIAFERMCREN